MGGGGKKLYQTISLPPVERFAILIGHNTPHPLEDSPPLWNLEGGRKRIKSFAR
jgi:hypothetical protein